MFSQIFTVTPQIAYDLPSPITIDQVQNVIVSIATEPSTSHPCVIYSDGRPKICLGLGGVDAAVQRYTALSGDQWVCVAYQLDTGEISDFACIYIYIDPVY